MSWIPFEQQITPLLPILVLWVALVVFSYWTAPEPTNLDDDPDIYGR